jgi:hypothetical protein
MVFDCWPHGGVRAEGKGGDNGGVPVLLPSRWSESDQGHGGLWPVSYLDGAKEDRGLELLVQS